MGDEQQAASMKEKNISIEAFRFIFMTILCLNHIEGMIHVMNHGYLVVEFFFMLSGYFMYSSLLRNPNRTTIDYTIKKLKRFFVEYAIALVPIFFIHQRGAMAELTLDGLLNFVMRFFSELFFVHRIGIYPDGLNRGTWYLSVLVVGGGILYALLREKKQLAVSVIIPIFCIITYTCFFDQGSSKTFDQWHVVNGMALPFMRGIADMGLGIMLCHIIQSKPDILNGHSLLFNIASVTSLIFIMLLIICYRQKDAYMLIFCPIFLAGLFSEKSWFHKVFRGKVWSFLGDLSYDMLLVHFIVRAPLVYFNVYQKMSSFELILLYMAFVLALSYLLKLLGEKIRAKLRWT